MITHHECIVDRFACNSHIAFDDDHQMIQQLSNDGIGSFQTNTQIIGSFRCFNEPLKTITKPKQTNSISILMTLKQKSIFFFLITSTEFNFKLQYHHFQLFF